jgi:hypothetical protein
MAGQGVFADVLDVESATFSYYGDGQWKKSSSAHFIPVLNPTTGNPQFKITGTFVFFFFFFFFFFFLSKASI